MTRGRLRDSEDRQARAERILDATAGLLLRFGYRRITIEDIARRADVGKGTVYLHWKTRDDIFRAVFEREVGYALDELLRTLRADTGGWLPHRVARSYFLAIMSRPLLQAVFLADAEVLGTLAGPDDEARDTRHHLLSRTYFELLSRHGVLRDDLSAEAIAYAFVATLEGFIQAEATTAERPGSGIHDRAALLASTVSGAFETERTLAPATEQAVATQVAELFARLSDADNAARETKGK
jgi:AcrR family transcriptional regulator